MHRRVLRDPKYAAWLMKWFYENPDAWASIHRVCTMTNSRRSAGARKGKGRKVPPHARAAACRRAVLDHLASRPTFAFGADAIARRINDDAALRRRHNPDGPDWTECEVGRAVDALAARGLARFHFTWFCERKYYQATGEGRRTPLRESKGKQ
jgi:hypothetical protein